MSGEYVYLQSEYGEHPLFTVGHYAPEDGTWVPESDHSTRAEAAARVVELNGGAPIREFAEIERLQGLVAQAGVLLAKAQKERDAARLVLNAPANVQESLRLGKVAKEAWQRAADTGLAAEMTCWAEAADAVVADLRERAGGTP